MECHPKIKIILSRGPTGTLAQVTVVLPFPLRRSKEKFPYLVSLGIPSLTMK